MPPPRTRARAHTFDALTWWLMKWCIVAMAHTTASCCGPDTCRATNTKTRKPPGEVSPEADPSAAATSTPAGRQAGRKAGATPRAERGVNAVSACGGWGRWAGGPG